MKVEKLMDSSCIHNHDLTYDEVIKLPIGTILNNNVAEKTRYIIAGFSGMKSLVLFLDCNGDSCLLPLDESWSVGVNFAIMTGEDYNISFKPKDLAEYKVRPRQ